MCSAEPVEVRAERLRLFVAAIGEEPTMRAGEGPFLPGGWSYYMEPDEQPSDYPEELSLAWECATVAQELRDRQWAALQNFGAARAAGDEMAAVVSAVALGWHHRRPEEG